MARRGRPKMTTEEKAAKREERDVNAARDWAVRMPKDDEARRAPWDRLDEAKVKFAKAEADAKQTSGLNGAKDSLSNHGWDKPILALDAQMEKLSFARQVRRWRQMKELAKIRGWDDQSDLLDDAGYENEDSGSVFDSTAAGERHRSDKPRLVAENAAPQPQHEPALGIPLDEAQKLFEAANRKGLGVEDDSSPQAA